MKNMKKSLRYLYIVVFAICFLIGAVICIMNLPEVKILQMAKYIGKEMQEFEHPLYDKLEPFDIYKNREENPYMDEISINVTSPLLENEKLSSNTFTMNQASFHYKGVYHNQAKKLKGKFSLGALNLDLVEGNLYVDEDKAYVELPEIFSDCYYVDLKQIGKAFSQSEIASLTGKSLPKDLSIHPFSGTRVEDWDEIARYRDELIQHAINLKSYAKLEKGYDTAIVRRGNEEVKAKALTVKIQPYAMNDMLKYIDVVCLKSELYKSQAKHLFVKDSDRDFFEEDILAAKYSEDVVINLFLDSKNHLVKLETKTPLVIGEQEEKIFFTMELNGEKNSLSDISGSFTRLKNSNRQEYLYEIHMDNDGKEYHHQIIISDKHRELINCTETFDSENDSLVMDTKLFIDDTKKEIVIKGSFEKIQPGKGYTFHIADMYMNTNGEEDFRAAGDIKKFPADANPNMHTSMKLEEAKNIFTLTKKELLGIAVESMHAAIEIFR